MDIIWQKFKSFNSHHFVFVVLCSVIAYLFRASDTYRLSPVWRKRIDPSTYHRENDDKFLSAEYRLPSPIITDLESDGVNEILLITSDFKLNILALPDAASQDPDDQTLPHVVVKDKIRLSVDIGRHGRRSHPVAMATGFTVPYTSMMQIRKQIIVIVTDDWHVLCYAPDLKLLWKQHMMNISKVKDTYNVKAMGILITAHKVKKNDEGLVIIGGSFTHKTHEKEDAVIKNETEHSNHTTEDNTMTHFSSFALNAKDGTVRWHHLPGDFGEVVNDVKDIHGDHHWKLGLKRHRLHIGEAPWSFYKQELYKFLPHYWGDLKDTKLTLGRFQKVSDVDAQTDFKKTDSALTPEHLTGYAYGGHRPHSDHEHIQNPNAVVIHNHNGLEVLNLLTGRPITELKLPSDKAVYVDIDNDGNIERLSWGEIEGYSPCYIEIWRFHPLQEKIEQISVCRFTRVFFTSSWAFEEDNLKKLPPLVIKSIARKFGFFRYLLGHHLPTKSTSYDIITLGGMGKVSSFDREGNVNWQISTGTGWAGAAKDRKKTMETEKEKYLEFKDGFQPSRELMSLQVFGPKNVMVLVGYSEFVLLDLQNGDILTYHSLPCQPTAPVVIGDFDNDGLNDIIITCKIGYLGFTLHHQTNHIYTVLYAVAVFAAILLLSWFCSPETFYSDLDAEEEEEEDLYDD